MSIKDNKINLQTCRFRLNARNAFWRSPPSVPSSLFIPVVITHGEFSGKQELY